MAEKKIDEFSVKPVFEAGKVAYGNKEWESVVVQVSDLWSDILKEGDETKQNSMANDCVSAVASHFNLPNIDTPEVLVNSVEANPDNQQIFMARELVTQGLAHALENGTNVQQNAIASGSENEIKKVIPKDMDVMARDVRNATVDPEIGTRVDELEFTMSSGPGTDSQNADAVKTVIDDIKNWIKNNKIKNDDPRRGGTDRVISMLAQRERELRGVVNKTVVVGGVANNPDELALMNMLSQKGVGGTEGVSGKNMNPEMMRRIMELKLSSFDESEQKRWIVSIINTFTRGSTLFFAGGWQQAVQYVDQSIAGLEEKVYNSGDKTAIEKADKMKHLAGAMLNVAIQRESITHSDSTLSKYVNCVVPVDIMEDDNPYVWDSKARNLVLDFDPVVRKVYDFISQKSVDVSNDGEMIKQVRDYLGNIEATTEMLMKTMSKDKDFVKANESGGAYYLRSMVKAGIDLFAVDDGPGWVATVNHLADQGKLSWMSRSDVYQPKRSKTGIQGDQSVYSPKFDLKTGDGKLQVNHPVFPLLDDIVGLQRLKGVYGEDVLQPLERGLRHIVNYKWKYETKNDRLVLDYIEKNDKKVFKIKPYPRVSDMGWKDLGRIDKVLTLAVGNPHGDKIESIDPKDVEPVVENIKNMFSTDFGKREVAGKAVGLILAAKIDAAMTGNPDDALSNLARTTAVVFGTGKSEQLNRQTETLYGKDLSGDLGLLRAQIDRLGINIEVQEFKDALIKASTSSRNLKNAKMAKFGRDALAWLGIFQAGGDVAASVAGIKTK